MQFSPLPSEVSPMSAFSSGTCTTYPTARSSEYRDSWRRTELRERFSSRIASVTLLPSSSQINNKRRSTSLVATCVSGSGKTIAMIRENEFLVYKAGSGQQYSGKPKYVGRFEANGNWKSGLDGTHLKTQGPIMTLTSRYDFNCAAISDDFLAAGALGSNCLMIFSIAEAQKSGRCIGKQETEDTDRTIRKILFNSANTELAVLFSISASQKELWQFFSIENLQRLTATSNTRKNSVTVNDSTTIDFRQSPNISPDCEVQVDTVYQDSTRQLEYMTRDAKYSQDGRKLVTCTAHVYGTALVSIISKDDQNIWRLWGTRQIRRQLHNWDEGCLGFTSVAL
jgi:hypothetical protein